jgi:2-C-methyl-D-erythritol 4-phosphate cytidylyltransferase/2-C-methyl-D-erythritol 2,4-cyclodiphosphate synthase
MGTKAIIVAAGKGERAGGAVPKQRRLLAGKPVFRWSLDAFLAHDHIDTCVLVVPTGQERIYRVLSPDRVIVTAGGNSRTASVQAGLTAAMASGDDIVLIHDAARPGLNADIITDLITALSNAEAAAPALPVADALKRQSDGKVENVDRADLFRVQTPQAFRCAAISKALASDASYVDDLAAIEAQDGRVVLTKGQERLSKITFAEDHQRMEAMLRPTALPPRFGTGYDVHALEPDSQVTLCGITIPHTHSLVGHSDADVAWHALTDAILGGAALGDIGDHFPPTDPQWKGAASEVFLEHAVRIAAEQGWQLSSCDVTIICEAPKVKPHREAMRQRTAEITGLPLEAVSIKATTTEGLGFTGRREGIAAQASAVLAPATASD